MNPFTFSNYQDFGIFLKVNFPEILSHTNPSLHEKLNVMLSIYENSKGGCGCNLKKRREQAAASYLEGVPIIFQDADLSSFVKQTLGTDKLIFKNDSGEFFLI
mgnify:CR=1 FL=1|tara:strand:- start:590 stop:898 length:309 start_codon:yes stop_codon:yes gene_type:complete